MSIKSLSLVAAAALVLCAGAAQAQNRLVNGGFEDAQATTPGSNGSPPVLNPDLTKAQAWLPFQNGYVRSSDAYAGSWSALVNQTRTGGTGGMLQDTIYSAYQPALTVGDVLTLSFYAKAMVNDDVNFYNFEYNLKYLAANGGVVDESGAQNFAGKTNSNGWTLITAAPFAVPVGAVAALVEFNAKGGGRLAAFKVDEVSLVPEPETYAMMLLGLAGVGALVRRRRSV